MLDCDKTIGRYYIIGPQHLQGFFWKLPVIRRIQEDEVKNLIETSTTPATKPRPAITFEKEENVRIIEGPFKHFIGVVEEINEERGKLKVMVTIFGRPTPVELDFLQVEKL